MLIRTPVPLTPPELKTLTEFLGHPGKALLEKILRGKLVELTIESANEDLAFPLNVLADGPQNSKSRDRSIKAAKLKLFLDVIEGLSKPETEYVLSKFDVE
jgi:hypothetical protein